MEKSLLDLTCRLPGPLASKLLKERGFRVTKLEKEKGDPFLIKSLSDDPTFFQWYQNINQGKQVIKSDDPKVLEEEIKRHQVILTDRPLNQIKKTENKIVITLTSGWDKPMHDLNALAELGLLNHMQGNQLPPLPAAGVLFGHCAALEILSLWTDFVTNPSYIEKTVSLKSALTNGLSFLLPHWHPGMESFLHTGRYTCYQIYDTKDDHKVALAAVEKKYWLKFCEIFDFPYTEEERFSKKGSPQEVHIRKRLRDLTSQEIKQRLGDTHCCLSLFR